MLWVVGDSSTTNGCLRRGRRGPIVKACASGASTPKYLDQKGLVALWREGLLAQAVLRGATTGYQNHPQLQRFRAQPSPVTRHCRIPARGARRGGGPGLPLRCRCKIASGGTTPPIDVPQGQLDFEWRHLIAKLEARAPAWREALGTPDPLAHCTRSSGRSPAVLQTGNGRSRNPLTRRLPRAPPSSRPAPDPPRGARPPPRCRPRGGAGGRDRSGGRHRSRL